MNTVQATPNFQVNLDALRADSLNSVALFAVLCGYFWLTKNVPPGIIYTPPPVSAWVGTGLLFTGAGFSFLLKKERPYIATHLLVLSVLGAVVCAMVTYTSPVITYLFILPIVFASLLLNRSAFLLVSVSASLIPFVIHLTRMGLLTLLNDNPLHTALAILFVESPTSELFVPVVIIILVAIVSWLSTRNLYTALEWVWNGYEHARRNEQSARSHASELRRVLKALDESTHRLERSNYALNLARRQAEVANQLKQEFAQTISHELRTPLNLIVGFIEMMTESPEYYGSQLPPAYQRDLNIVYRNARHLQSLINDVLDLARIDAAQMSITPEKIDPAALATEAIDITRGLIEGRRLKLYTEFEPDLPQLWVDPIRIRQVLINLLSNAARSTEQGSITVRVRREDKYVVFSVADTGVGIAPENLERIFEEFLQLDGSTSRRNSGAGLGLAISQRFVELHDGDIWVESQLGSGSTFYFRLPIKPTDPVKLSGKYSPAQTMSVTGSEMPVLAVATESIAAATLLTRYLHDFRTVIVPGIDEAHDAIRAVIPQVVLIDQARAEPSVDRLRELAQAWELPGVPFISCPLPGEERLGRDLKVEGYLVKPVSRSTLWNTLRQFGMDIDTVLVIDDDLDFVQLMSRMLEDNPVRRYRVIGAYSGREGLDMVRLHQPDIVFLDLHLKDMDGARFVENMRSIPEQQSIPIVIISAQDNTDNQEPLSGGMVVTKQEGLTVGEIVRWVQAITDMTVASSSPLLAKRSSD